MTTLQHPDSGKLRAHQFLRTHRGGSGGVAPGVTSGAVVLLPVPFSVVISDKTGRLLHARLAKDHVGLRLPSVTAGLVRGGALVWTGGCGGVDGTVPGSDVQYRCGSI